MRTLKRIAFWTTVLSGATFVSFVVLLEAIRTAMSSSKDSEEYTEFDALAVLIATLVTIYEAATRSPNRSIQDIEQAWDQRV